MAADQLTFRKSMFPSSTNQRASYDLDLSKLAKKKFNYILTKQGLARELNKQLIVE